MNNPQFLAPQAYTKDVLRNALVWLESQPDSVKKQVNTNDQAVSLFLRAKRGNNFQSPTLNTKTIEQFQTDLKSLAESLRQFEGAEAASTSNTVSSNPVNVPRLEFQTSPQHSPSPATSSPVSVAQVKASLPEVSVPQQFLAPIVPQENPVQTRPTSVIDALDPKSREVVLAVCQRLNLSDPEQAIRMLLILGSEKLKVLD